MVSFSEINSFLCIQYVTKCTVLCILLDGETDAGGDIQKFYFITIFIRLNISL